MVSRSLRGLVLATLILGVGLWYSAEKTTNGVVLTAILTTIILVRIVNRFIKGENKEIFISGFILAVVESYVFLIQPETGLPELPGAVKLFFGVAAVTRLGLLLVELIDTPFKKPARELLGK